MLLSVVVIFKYILLLILGLTILVFVHELGHFIPAKLFGMRVEKFFIFFDWPTKLWSKKIGETEYGIGVLPLGGYVKIAGIIDESLDTEALKEPPKEWEFRAKPLWQRFIVMIGGITMNVLLGILIFTIIKYNTGEVKTPMAALKYGIDVPDSSLAQILGFQTGDIILEFKGKPVKYLEDINNPSILLEENAYFKVLRGKDTIIIKVPENFIEVFTEFQKKGETLLFYPNVESYVIPIEGYPAEKAGIKKGDKIIEINGIPVETFGEIRKIIKNSNRDTLTIKVLRQNKELTFNVVPTKNKKIGIAPDLSRLPVEKRKYTFVEAIIVGTKTAFGVLYNNILGFKKILTGQISAKKSLAGPVKMAKIMGQSYEASGWLGFWTMVGVFSMILAFMNILPIPALDGGHLMFLLIEAIIRKEPSEKVRIVAQQIGMALLLALMAYVIFNDIVNF